MSADAENKGLFREIIDTVSLSKSELTFYSLVGVFIIIANRVIWFLETNNLLNIEIAEINTFFAELQSNQLLSTLVTFFTWFVIGILIYMLFWVMLVTIIDSYNNLVVSETFVHPTSFHKSTFWLAIIGRFFIRVSSVGLLAFIVLFSFQYIFSLLISFSNEIFYEFSIINLIKLLLVPIITVVLIQICVILLRFIFLKRRLSFEG